ncbi:hypothetical protein ACWGID_11480 [Kribbella sp. NPDC054772]
MSVGKTAGWTLGGLLLGVLAGFAAELFRTQSSVQVEQRYVAPRATRTPDARTPSRVPEPAAEPAAR